MADLVSPGVQIKEKDLTTTVTSPPGSIGAVAIVASKGYADSIVTVGSEEELVEHFGKPSGSNFEYWFSAANFLGYTNNLKVVRALQPTMMNATGAGAGALIPNTIAYQIGDGTNGPYSGGEATGLGSWAARTPGTWGNSLQVSACTSGDAYYKAAKTSTTSALAAGDTTIPVSAVTDILVGSIVSVDGDTPGSLYKVTAINSLVLTIARYPTQVATGIVATTIVNTSNLNLYWEWYDQFDGPPGTSQYATDHGASTDELHIVVVDEDGDISGVKETVLERFDAVSKASDALTDEGGQNYYADVLYADSAYIYWLDHPAGGTNWGTSVITKNTYTAATAPVDTESLVSGADGTTVTNAQRLAAYDKFKDADSVDIQLVIEGPPTISGAADVVLANHLTDLVNGRKDCMAFLSPEKDAVINKAAGAAQAAVVETWGDTIASSSYVVMDSGWFKIYDKYNDLFRWIPLNSATAGTCAATDILEDPWWSPGGLTRGQIRSSIELAFNPSQTQRDGLYRKRVNPIVTFPGEGTVLWGDKTALSSQSAFSRINVRRLFITIEEACKVAARSILFDFNDDFTRENFRSMIDPYLRDIQARRGITDFEVVCDTSNNTPQVIDANKFVADVYVKPARSINFITLTFIATRTGVDFSEVVGRA